jgi:hypothetical protein
VRAAPWPILSLVPPAGIQDFETDGPGRGGDTVTILYLVGFGLIALSVLASRDRVPC